MVSARVRLAVAAFVLATGYWLLATDLVAEQPTFKAGVTLVTTDVIPRDQNGRFVANLTRDDFTILEDGQPQQVASFLLVQGGRVFNLLQPAPAAAAPE